MSEKSALEIALNPTGFLIGKIAEYAFDSVTGSSSEKGVSPTDESIKELQLVARKQEIEMQMAEAQAKVAQELAIAKKIETADEVEIEEFYDLSGDGQVGLSQNGEAITVGLSASGRRVTKRIYKFRGRSFNPDPIDSAE